MWDISPKSPIGSSIDENGLFSVGINKTDVSIMETVVVTDKLNGNMTESASVIIKSIEQEPSGCELSINIASATVLPGDTIKFSANNIGDKCEKGGFKWTINSKIGSSISSNGLYTAKSNHTDNSALDIIIVEDKSNQLRTNAIVTVLPEEKATLPVNDSKIPPQQKKPSERGGYSKVLTAFAIIVLLIVVVLYLRRRGQNVHTKDNRT
jgi:hypothetical protein